MPVARGGHETRSRRNLHARPLAEHRVDCKRRTRPDTWHLTRDTPYPQEPLMHPTSTAPTLLILTCALACARDVSQLDPPYPRIANC